MQRLGQLVKRRSAIFSYRTNKENCGTSHETSEASTFNGAKKLPFFSPYSV